MTDEIETEGFARRYVGARGEFLLRVNERVDEMARRVGRRRAYEVAGLDSFNIIGASSRGCKLVRAA